jgi:hypothetical protein
VYRSFHSFVLVYIHYQKVTGADRDNSQIDSRLLASFSYVNSLNLFLYIADTGEWRQKVSYFAGDE